MESSSLNLSESTQSDGETLKGRRVLLVDDNEIDRDLDIQLLRDLGINVEVADSGREGFERIVSTPFDLVLMNVHMPAMDGLAATRLIRTDRRFRQLPIIALTAQAMSGDRERSRSAGMNDHLTRPLNLQILQDALVRWMPMTAVGERRSQALEARFAVESEIPASLPPFDVRAALERTNGNTLLLRRLMKRFSEQFRDAALDLRDHLAQQRPADAERLAHSLKGSAATLEASALTQAALAVELAIHRGNAAAVDQLIDALERELAPAITAAQSLEVQPVADKQSLKPLAPALVHQPSTVTLPCILAIDDDYPNLELLANTFGSEYELLIANDGTTALYIAERRAPDVILLDVMMPGIDGYEVCKRLKADPRTANISVIFITGAGDDAAELKSLELGAADFIPKPINPAVVKARVNSQIKLKSMQDKLTRLASTDGLTGLANRRRFDEMFAYEYARHMRSGTRLAIILLDIDHFKAFNDEYGHLTGDDCLREVARAIAGSIVRTTDLAARFGGEEFIVLLPETTLQGALILAERIRVAISRLSPQQSSSVVARSVTASLGVVSARCFSGGSPNDILSQVDTQLYAAKNAGRNCIRSADLI